jgi:hypothetical protein
MFIATQHDPGAPELLSLDTAEEIADRMNATARALAERWIGEALAGDDERLRFIFGLNGYRPTQDALMQDYLPRGWHLLRALAERFPDLLASEVMRQQDLEIAALRQEAADLRAHLSTVMLDGAPKMNA